MDPEIRNGLRRIINAHDPMGIYFGEDVNFDEYDPEIGDILTEFKRSKNLEEFTNKVHAIFVKWFSSGIAGPRSKYRNLAEEIYEFLRVNCLKDESEKR